MYDYEEMTGKFGYRENCSVPHYLPQGAAYEGHPVIVFPQRDSQVTIGSTYRFTAKMTRNATYVIDGVVYRVAHAIAPIEVTGTEGTAIDQILELHEPTKFTLGDRFSPELVERMRAIAGVRE